MNYKIFFATLLFSVSLMAQDNPMQLNHIYFVLDSTSYAEVKKNRLFKDFANFDEGLPNFRPVSNGTSIIYMRGKNTYIEIMGPENKYNEKVGSIGIGFSWDTKLPFNDAISEKTLPQCIDFKKYEATREFHNEKIAWFSSFYIASQTTAATWYAFYNPGFLSILLSEKKTSFSRADYLEKSFDPKKNFRDIAEITLQCNLSDFERIKQEHYCLGSKIVASSKTKIVYEIDSLIFTIELRKEKKTMLKKIALEFHTNPEINLQLGNITLASLDNKLVLEFKED